MTQYQRNSNSSLKFIFCFTYTDECEDYLRIRIQDKKVWEFNV